MAEKAVKKTAKTAPSRRPDGKTDGAEAEGPSIVEDVEKLVQLMVDNELSELNIKEGGRKIHLKRGQSVVMAPATAVGPPAGPATVPEGKHTHSRQSDEPAADLVDIVSPMVGTVYAAPSPDSDPFVAAGDAVSADDVVCIIEAMKVMNEIRAECAGTITEICVKNAQPVEYGQTLFKVKPA